MASKIMDKTRQDHQQQLQAAAAAAQLKCPRCDSSNTKFCYYNNYSLSQPRHFCKACKRYWTRGGTLRNVPVGGGCRKNKRLKTSSSSSTPSSNTNPHPQNSSINVLSSSVSNHMSPPIMFYGASADSNLQFSRLVPPPQLDNIGLGFSSHIADLRDGFDSIKQIQDMVTSNNNNHFGHPAISFERNMQVLGNSEEVKMDHQSQNRSSSCQNQMEQNQMDLSFNDASHFWNPMNSTSNWLDQMNTGSSLTNSLF